MHWVDVYKNISIKIASLPHHLSCPFFLLFFFFFFLTICLGVFFAKNPFICICNCVSSYCCNRSLEYPLEASLYTKSLKLALCHLAPRILPSLPIKFPKFPSISLFHSQFLFFYFLRMLVRGFEEGAQMET